MDERIQRIVDCIVELNLRGVESALNDAISAGTTPNEIITKGISQAAKEVGERYENSIYFLPELVMAGEVIKAVMKNLEPHMNNEPQTDAKGVFVIGTVEGDIHDIGKNLVIIFLRGHGYQVHDLGVDVPAERYVEAVRETRAQALGLSALL
ncbi:MAG: B12-binding domain-containing protein, partial [Aigarchaeota archaeon]|nr:B12-binding domain-containing protein [Aigarchaeota archaeon]